MKKYFSFFRLRFVMGLQYRIACGNFDTVLLGTYGNHDIPRLLPDRCFGFPDDFVRHHFLHLAAASFSGLFYGMDDGK